MSVYISLFISSNSCKLIPVNSCKLYQQIPVICTSEFRELFEATTFMLSKCAYSLFDIVTYINPLTPELNPPPTPATLMAVWLFKGLTARHIYIYVCRSAAKG